MERFIEQECFKLSENAFTADGAVTLTRRLCATSHCRSAIVNRPL